MIRKLIIPILILLVLPNMISAQTDEYREDYTVEMWTTIQTAPAVEDLPLMSSITQHGITWYFSEPERVGRFVNGDYYVIGTSSDPVQITRISPEPVSNPIVYTSESCYEDNHWECTNFPAPYEGTYETHDYGGVCRGGECEYHCTKHGSVMPMPVSNQESGFDSRVEGNRYTANLRVYPPNIYMYPGDSHILCKT